MSKRRDFSIEMLQDYADQKGGKLLSKDYINSTSTLLWCCKNGHKWKATALEIVGKKSQKGRWCPKCQMDSSLKLSLDDLEEIK